MKVNVLTLTGAAVLGFINDYAWQWSSTPTRRNACNHAVAAFWRRQRSRSWGGSETYQGNAAAGLSGCLPGSTWHPVPARRPHCTGGRLVLTSGSANLPLTNTTNQFNPVFPASGSNALLGALSASAGGTAATNDANVISFDFTVAAGMTSVSAQFVFGTDEFPTQSVTDIFGFFVDGCELRESSRAASDLDYAGNPTTSSSIPWFGLSASVNGLTKLSPW